MSAPIHVTEAESEVLAALWRRGPLTPARLVEAVKARRAWGDATIKTLLGRLMQKKAIRSGRDDGRLLYHPLVTREMYIMAEVQTLADHLFEGDPRQLAQFISVNWPSR
ncbi:MAG: BlaI/MecI/CopY family transcriptional regulator [Caulobacteraceae bacterium]